MVSRGIKEWRALNVSQCAESVVRSGTADEDTRVATGNGLFWGYQHSPKLRMYTLAAGVAEGLTHQLVYMLKHYAAQVLTHSLGLLLRDVEEWSIKHGQVTVQVVPARRIKAALLLWAWVVVRLQGEPVLGISHQPLRALDSSVQKLSKSLMEPGRRHDMPTMAISSNLCVDSADMMTKKSLGICW